MATDLINKLHCCMLEENTVTVTDTNCILYYSKFDKDYYIVFHWVQCNEPNPLSLDNFLCFSLISTKFEGVIVIASS